MRFRFLRNVLLSAGLMFMLTTAALIASSAALQTDPEDAALIGTWEGVLNAQGIQLRIVFHISVNGDGALTAVMDSPDQGVTGIPVDEVEVKGDHLRMSVKSIMGVYEGDIQKDSVTINGTWKQGGGAFALILKKGVPAPGSTLQKSLSQREADQTWLGAPKVNGGTLRIVFRVFQEPEGTFRALMDSPDQGAKDIPVTRATIEGGKARFEVNSIGLVFEGKLREDGTAIDGKIIQMGMEIPAVLNLVDSYSSISMGE